MKKTLMSIAVLGCFAPHEPSYSWTIEPATMRGTHGWPHGMRGYPLLVRAPLSAGVARGLARK